MSDTNGQELTPEVRVWIETWKTCVEQVLSQISGQTMAFEISQKPWSGAESDLWYSVTASGAANGEMRLRLPADAAIRLAQKFLSETEPAAELSSEHKEALEELLRQMAGQAATALAASVGGEVHLQLAAATASSWRSANTLSLRTRDEAGSPVVIEIQMSPDLVSTLRPRPSEQSPAPADASAAPVDVSPEAASYQRLMDVGLEVKLRFGTRRMVLRDVLALSAGVVVELDSNVNSPVNLLLDGRTIAQGEVVVVDGKYGFRVTQVLDRRDSA